MPIYVSTINTSEWWPRMEYGPSSMNKLGNPWIVVDLKSCGLCSFHMSLRDWPCLPITTNLLLLAASDNTRWRETERLTRNIAQHAVMRLETSSQHEHIYRDRRAVFCNNASVLDICNVVLDHSDMRLGQGLIVVCRKRTAFAT